MKHTAGKNCFGAEYLSDATIWKVSKCFKKKFLFGGHNFYLFFFEIFHVE